MTHRLGISLFFAGGNADIGRLVDYLVFAYIFQHGLASETAVFTECESIRSQYI